MHLELQGDFAYATSRSNNWFAVFDISNPGGLVLRSQTSQNLAGAEGFVIDSNLAYVASYYNGDIAVFDISDPDTVVTNFVLNDPNTHWPLFIEKTHRWLWVITEYSLGYPGFSEAVRYDAINADTLIEKNRFYRPTGVIAATASGNRLYIGTNTFGGNYFEALQVNPQQLNNVVISPRINVPQVVDLDAKGSDLYVSIFTQGPNSDDAKPLVVNFDISVLEPELRWVAPGVAGKVCAIDHTMFLSNRLELGLYELNAAQENLDLIRTADGALAYRNSPWYRDSVQNVIAEYGYIGIGIDSPEVKLHLNGDQRIDGNHTIEFGADIPGKDINAGKIGNAILSSDALDITGAGYPGLRGIRLFGEDAIDLSGTLQVDGGSVHSGQVFAEMGMDLSGRVGIGAFPNPNQMLLVDDGIRMGTHGSTRAGVWINQPDNVSDNATFIGHRDDQTFGIKTQAGWSLLQNGTTGHFGMGMEPGEQMLSVEGSCKASYVSSFNVNSNGTTSITGNHVFDLDGDALPQIGYETFTPGALDILGLGDPETRQLFFDALGGTTIDGNLEVAGELRADTIFTQHWLELAGSLQNGWVNYGNGFVTIAMYKDLTGVVHLRGLIKDGLNQQNTIILNLPNGYRPVDGHQIYAVPNGVNTAGRIDVESDGDVVFRGITNTFISLDQIAFKSN